MINVDRNHPMLAMQTTEAQMLLWLVFRWECLFLYREDVNYLLSRFSLIILYVKLIRTALDISSLSSVTRNGKMTSMVESRAGGVFSTASMWIVRYQGFERIHWSPCLVERSKISKSLTALHSKILEFVLPFFHIDYLWYQGPYGTIFS